MSRTIYIFALLIAVITFVLCIIAGISFFTSFIRTIIVFIGILFTFFIAGQLLQLGFTLTAQKPKRKAE